MGRRANTETSISRLHRLFEGAVAGGSSLWFGKNDADPVTVSNNMGMRSPHHFPVLTSTSGAYIEFPYNSVAKTSQIKRINPAGTEAWTVSAGTIMSGLSGTCSGWAPIACAKDTDSITVCAVDKAVTPDAYYFAEVRVTDGAVFQINGSGGIQYSGDALTDTVGGYYVFEPVSGVATAYTILTESNGVVSVSGGGGAYTAQADFAINGVTTGDSLITYVTKDKTMAVGGVTPTTNGFTSIELWRGGAANTLTLPPEFAQYIGSANIDAWVIWGDYVIRGKPFSTNGGYNSRRIFVRTSLDSVISVMCDMAGLPS